MRLLTIVALSESALFFISVLYTCMGVFETSVDSDCVCTMYFDNDCDNTLQQNFE